MSIKTILSTALLIAGISLGAVIFSFSGNSSQNYKNGEKLYASCDPSQWTYKEVFIDGVWWIIVYDCDGIIINEYPETA